MQAARRTTTLILVFALALAFVWLKPIDTMAKRYVDAGLQRALTTFAAARALDAVLSAVQSASITVGIGVGASVHPGAVLEPIDDLVEQFSALMLAVTISFAAQHLLIEIFGAWPVAALFSASIVLWFTLRWRGHSPAWLTTFTLGLLCLRLAVPLLALSSEATYQLLLAQDYEASQAEIKNVDLPDAAAEPGEGLGSKFKRWWSESTDVARKVEALRSRVDGLVAHMVRLAAVFIVQTVVLPLMFFCLLVWVYRTLAGVLSPYGRRSEPLVRRLQSET